MAKKDSANSPGSTGKGCSTPLSAFLNAQKKGLERVSRSEA